MYKFQTKIKYKHFPPLLEQKRQRNKISLPNYCSSINIRFNLAQLNSSKNQFKIWRRSAPYKSRRYAEIASIASCLLPFQKQNKIYSIFVHQSWCTIVASHSQSNLCRYIYERIIASERQLSSLVAFVFNIRKTTVHLKFTFGWWYMLSINATRWHSTWCRRSDCYPQMVTVYRQVSNFRVLSYCWYYFSEWTETGCHNVSIQFPIFIFI